jgi:type IV pilus assembly protein PilB
MALNVSADELRDLLVDRLEVMDQTEFDRAQAMATRVGIPLERALVERGRIPFDFLLEQLAQAWGVRFINLKVSDVNPDSLRSVREDFARSHTLVPFARDSKELLVAMWDPRNKRVIDEVERLTGLRVVPHLAPARAIQRAQLLYQGDVRAMLERAASGAPDAARRPGRAGEDDRSATDLLQRLLEYAAICRASDIHIEPYELEVVVRCRIDGTLHEVLSLPPTALSPLAVRVKILSGLRIDERRAPQDGRFQADLGGLQIDFRVSTMPTIWGEKIVLRVLAKESIALDLEDLGLAGADYDILFRNLMRPFGMLLITGPTGSGKTTTLYAMLTRLGVERQHVVNISTVEDPVEYTLPRINQVPLNPAAGLDFTSGLRALLRQDPDIIMVGEIRDRETVEIAIRAALVGRLLISTLHTNDSTGAIPRLLDMGVEPFLIASTLVLVVAQRLVRRICATCRESVVMDPDVLGLLRERRDFDATLGVLQGLGVLRRGEDPLSGVRLFRGKGCRQCNGTGFRGRLGLFELFEIDDRVRAMIMERRDAETIRAMVTNRGMKTLFQDGLGKVFLGETTLEEVLRVAL